MKKRVMSPEARKKISDGMKRRYAKLNGDAAFTCDAPWNEFLSKEQYGDIMKVVQLLKTSGFIDSVQGMRLQRNPDSTVEFSLTIGRPQPQPMLTSPLPRLRRF